jgi:tetratricopeptide (TPR) repeat protein
MPITSINYKVFIIGNPKFLLFAFISLMAFSVLAQEEPLPEHLAMPDLPKLETAKENPAENTEKKPESEPKIAETTSDNEEKKVIENLAEDVFAEKKDDKKQEVVATETPAEKITKAVTSPENSQKNEVVEADVKNETEKTQIEQASDVKKLEPEKTLEKAVEATEVADVAKKEAENQAKISEVKKNSTDEKSEVAKAEENISENQVNKIIEEAKKQTEEKIETETVTDHKILKLAENTSKETALNANNSSDVKLYEYGNYTKLSLPKSMGGDYQPTSQITINSIVDDNPEKSETIYSSTEYTPVSVEEFNQIADISELPRKNPKINIKEDITIERGSFQDPFYEEIKTEEVANNDVKLPESEDVEENLQAISEQESEDVSAGETKHKAKQVAKVDNKPTEFFLKEKSLKVEIKKDKRYLSKYLKNAFEALQVGQFESAISYYREVLKANPNNIKAQFGLATAYHKAGQYENAKDEYSKLLQKNKNYWPALNNYLILVSQEYPETAIERLEELKVKNPDYAAIPAQIGSLYYSRGKIQRAADYYLEAVNLEPKNSNYRYNLAVVLEQLSQKLNAAKVYKSLLDDAARGEKIPENANVIAERYFSLLSEN